jgi:hypothetical protein
MKILENGVLRDATSEELEQAHIDGELTAAGAAMAYRARRAAKYPSIGDQLDALFHAGIFPPEMAVQIQAVKDAYPKPE